MLPTIAVIGRPNVGKSTLFNRLVGRKIAIVDDTPGVTRDRKEAETRIGGRDVRILDTAGLEEAAPETIQGRMRASSEQAVREADLVIFVVDARAGLTPSDRAFGEWLRRQTVPVVLVANKTEGRQGGYAAMEAYELGLGDPIAVSAEHGDGIGELHDAIRENLPEELEEDEREDPDRPLRLAIIGRPNAGKSTLLNALLGEERMITGPEPGLTRDSVAVEWTDPTGGKVRLVDTAGLRKKARIEKALEKMSTAASIAALKECEVAILVVDALLGMDEQDLRLARLAEREGSGDRPRLQQMGRGRGAGGHPAQAGRRADGQPGAAARHHRWWRCRRRPGAGVDKLMPAVRQAYALWNRRIPTGELNRWFEDMLTRHPPPLAEGRRIKLRYATMPKARPPTIAVFGTRAEQLPEDYRRYLVNGFREAFDMPGVPVRLNLRGTSNPYAEAEG